MKKIFIYSIFLLALVERVWFDLGPNIELITLATILSAFYLDKKSTLLLTLTIMLISDLIIGNTNIFIFTWSGFVLPALAVTLLPKLNKNKIFLGTASGIFANLFFFTWTNFGVWLLDSWNMYPNTLLGLVQSFINGIPFLKNQLLSTLVFVPLGFILYEITFNILPTFSKAKRALSKSFFV